MSGAGSAAGSAKRGRGSRAREAIEARRHGLAACRDQRNEQVFQHSFVAVFFVRFGTRYIRWWKVQFFTADDPVGQLRFSNAQDSIDLDGKVNSLVLIEK